MAISSLSRVANATLSQPIEVHTASRDVGEGDETLDAAIGRVVVTVPGAAAEAVVPKPCAILEVGILVVPKSCTTEVGILIVFPKFCAALEAEVKIGKALVIGKAFDESLFCDLKILDQITPPTMAAMMIMASSAITITIIHFFVE